MKKIIVTGFIVAFLMLVIPMSLAKKPTETAKPTAARVSVKAETKDENAVSESAYGETFRIKTEDKIIELTAEEYITGVVAAEMPASFEAEALKAQSVAAYSFALYRKDKRKGEEYDLTDSFKTDQSYLSNGSLKEKWGEAYDENIKKIKEAVRSVSGQYLSYDGAVALALYHSVSAGRTNACADIFGSEVPYLVSVDSKTDILSPDYKSVFSFSYDELNGKLKSIANASGADRLSDSKTDENGLVKEIKFSGVAVSGIKLSGLLGLSSPNFSVEYSDGAYTFYCLGHGHGVGMSQYGANQLALTGSTYKEILKHYYPGTEIKKK